MQCLLILLLPQSPAQPNEVGLQILVGAEGAFEVVGVVGGEGVVVEGGSGRRVLLSRWGRLGIGLG